MRLSEYIGYDPIKIENIGINIKKIRLLSSIGDPYCKEAIKYYKKILMEEIK